MKKSGSILQGILSIGTAALMASAMNCGGESGNPAQSTGGKKSGGSPTASGGQTASGGITTGSGGSSATGGATTSTGGTSAGSGGSTPTTGGATASTGGTIASSGGAVTATGGATPATGGVVTGAGGTTAATGGSTTDGGTTPPTGGTVALSCSPGISPADPLISDFSLTSWNMTTGKWGVAGNLTGSIFAYPDPNKLSVIKSFVMTESLVLDGIVNPGPTGGGYAGGGMAFGQCVNTKAYSGIQFTLGGIAGYSEISFQVQTYSQQPVKSGGSCTATSCHKFPKKKVAIGAGPITVTFAELAGTGLPATAEGIMAEIVGLQWHFQLPAGIADGGIQTPCPVSLTIDDVKFVP